MREAADGLLVIDTDFPHEIDCERLNPWLAFAMKIIRR